ncbi:MAG: thioesterase family protein [Acidimicrobiales bacterium]
MERITTSDFLGLDQRANGRWELPVIDRICGGGRGSLFGGAGLAAGVEALERETGKPTVWATGQYVSVTAAGDTIDLDVQLPAVGRTVTQGRVIGHVGERHIITLLGAVGQRTEVLHGVWDAMPDAGRPEDAPLVERHAEGENVHHHVEARIARGSFGFAEGAGTPSGDNRTLLWVRMPGVWLDAAALAMLGDYMPSALGNAFGRVVNCTSLDNTIRFAAPLSEVDAEGWVLCDNRIEFVGNGFAHGSCFMWSEDGRMLATASQSVLVVPPT